jgi:hypothetical protein
VLRQRDVSLSVGRAHHDNRRHERRRHGHKSVHRAGLIHRSWFSCQPVSGVRVRPVAPASRPQSAARRGGSAEPATAGAAWPATPLTHDSPGVADGRSKPAGRSRLRDARRYVSRRAVSDSPVVRCAATGG